MIQIPKNKTTELNEKEINHIKGIGSLANTTAKFTGLVFAFIILPPVIRNNSPMSIPLAYFIGSAIGSHFGEYIEKLYIDPQD